jgi:hypothetical protein
MSRGEFEPAQLIVHADGKDLTGVRVNTTDLAGPDGHSIPKGRIAVNPHGFLKIEAITKGWTPLLGKTPGLVPDVLMPDRPMDVSNGHRQSFFITIKTLQTDPPGRYRGTVRVTADGGRVKELELLVRVYDVVLPIKPHLRTSFGIEAAGFDEKGEPQGYRKLEGADNARDLDTLIAWSKFMLEHRVTPCVFGYTRGVTGVPPIHPNAGQERDWTATDRFFSELKPLGLTSFYAHGEIGDPRYVAHMKEKGWWPLVYAYIHDEPNLDLLPMVRQTYRSLAGIPGIHVLQTEWNPSPPLEGLVNIWCPVMDKIDTQGIRDAHERGEEVWWYTWFAPLHPYPNICHIDYPGIYVRITGWMTYHYEVDGFLYWLADLWNTHTNHPIGNTVSAQEHDAQNYANWPPDTRKKDRTGKNPRNGDGQLLYPDKDNNPVASIRLALTRDGFEDYDLFREVEILTRANDSADATRARELLDFTRPFDSPLIVSLTKWSKHDNRLMQRREAILKVGEAMRRPEDNRLRSMRLEQTELDAGYYPPPTKKDKRKSGFGISSPTVGQYVDGEDCQTLLKRLDLVEKLPLEGWLFKADPESVGKKNGYFKSDIPTAEFSKFRIGEFWDEQGHPELREGWYRFSFTCPDLPDGKDVYFLFESVDEAAWLYVDGKLIAWYDSAKPALTWQKPFLLNVTSALKSGAEHLLTIRVRNDNGLGGIYKPVNLMVEK